LRQNGIDPFERSSILELVAPSSGGNGGGTTPPTGTALAAGGKMQLPQTIQQGRALAAPDPAAAAERRASEIMRIQQDLIRRRRQRLISLFSRLAVFVLLPTLLAGYYYFVIATPMYATKSEFVIQQSQPAGGAAGGLSGLFQGTSLATQADAIAVQSYLTSRAAMVRLDEEEGFKAHFSQDHIDPIQRLDPVASNEAAYKLYQRLLTIGYDPTEGIVKMEVIAADPETSQRFSEALISYAEEQVDQLTQRMREDQMSGANASYEEAEARRKEALEALLTIQEDLETFSPDSEAQLVMTQIGQLQTRRQDKILELASLQSVARPNEARVNAVNSEIASRETSIDDLRLQLTETTGSGNSLAAKTTELRAAEENYQFQIALVQQALTMMETARLEANRQVRYLSLGVVPIAPDDPTYPKAFENTLVSFLIFAGIYLMFSLTASILREQVSS
jgi:capsular polysaccharide transport system permease protein